MNRRHFLKSSLAGAGALAFPTLANASTPARIPDFPFEEATVADLQATIQSGKISCEELTQLYLKRIQDADRSGPKLNSIIEINPDAVSIARDRDADSRKGPLHGMPVLIKDNIESGDRMKTTAGSLALNDNIAQNDAPIVKGVPTTTPAARADAQLAADKGCVKCHRVTATGAPSAATTLAVLMTAPMPVVTPQPM